MNSIVGWLKFLNIILQNYILSEIGQAFLWGSLFLIWGISLLIFLKQNNLTRLSVYKKALLDNSQEVLWTLII